MKRISILPALAFAIAACGGGEPADTAAEAPAAPAETAVSSAPAGPTGPMTQPDWFHVSADDQTVHMTITAGSTTDNNYWNFNGASRGSMAVTVPEGYTVTIDLVNNDPVMPHSLGISPESSNFSGLLEATSVFEGAITENPTSMVDGTMPGETESITFVADAAGNYSMVCFITGHSLAGMWIYFNVSADGEAGVQSD